MAPQPNNVVQASRAGRPTDSIRPAGAAFPPELPLFRFSLRHLLFFVAVLSTLMAALVSLHGIPILALLLAALVVAFHVLGTALGSELRLRARSRQERGIDMPTPNEPPTNSPDESGQRLALKPLQLPWFGRYGASFAWLPRLVATSVFFGGCLGAFFLTAIIGDRTSPAGIIVGSLSIAVMTGWFAFLGGGFYVIVRHAFREAVAEPREDDARRVMPH